MTFIQPAVSNETQVKPKPAPIVRYGDFLLGFLLLSALGTAGGRLIATHWTEELDIVQVSAFFGCLAGLALGQSRFSRKLSGLFAFLYGSFVVPWQLGLTISGSVEWSERLLSIVGRLQLILSDIYIRRAVEDNLFFLLLMACLFWSLGVTSGFLLARYGEPWQVILPPGLALFVIDLFDQLLPRRSWYMAIYIFFSLFILARLYFLHQRKDWDKRRTFIPSDIGFDISRYTALITLLIVLLAWNLLAFNQAIPVVADAYRVLSEPYLNFKDKNSFLFAALESSFNNVTDFYGSFQTLGGGSIKSERVVMNVDVPQRLPAAARLYWRARSYDFYQRGQWSTNIDEKLDFNPEDGVLPVSSIYGRVEAEFVFRPLIGIVTLYAPSQPVWFSRSGELQLDPHTDGTMDLISLKAEPYLRPGEQYRARSQVGAFTQKQLREAGETYPYWVMDRYVQLPPDITPRTLALAKEITAGAETPYDKAEAITNWLRANMKYAEMIEQPPARQEAVDWFLFDYRQGFCNYYAAAEVIMLRSLGIPARWVVGYAQGVRQENEGNSLPNGVVRYNVREKDSHAWPEVYFPNFGWVEFEPTVSQLAIERPSGEVTLSQIDPSAQPTPERNLPELDPEVTPIPTAEPLSTEPQQQATFAGAFALISALAAVVLLVIVWLTRRGQGSMLSLWVRLAGGSEGSLAEWEAEGANRGEQFSRGLALLGQRLLRRLSDLGLRPPARLQRWSQFTLMPLIAQAYHAVNQSLQDLDSRPPLSATPAERAAALVKIMPASQQSVDDLLTEYQKASYSSLQPDLGKARQAASLLRQLTRSFIMKKLFSRSKDEDKP